MKSEFLCSRSILLAATGLLLSIAPVCAQIGGGNDNGVGYQSVSAPRTGVRDTTYPPQSQTAVDRFSQSLTADRIGDAATFDVINGGAPAPLVNSLIPTGVAADSATVKAASNLASTLKGLRSSDGTIDAAKLNLSVSAFNEYVKVLVSEQGMEKAIANAPATHKAVQGLLGQLVRVANQATPTTTPPAPNR
jgi:hypothetical protein